ncbi:MAG: hypothetical protein J7619_31675 [Dyadobacter sp.]|uniref:hypothetical protein n=1 Tax=Dyadobacter sp. TaxID=1914288 RepID=UPI001B2C6D47|nr:hypothetical protein [Dyadobacter sp.]MBO9617287.1 hypothetical protein [Dyadobacter sp.]
MKPKTHISGLNEVQIALLRMFNRNIPDEELLEIRRVLVNHLSQRLFNEVDAMVVKKGITEADYKQLEFADVRTKPDNADE